MGFDYSQIIVVAVGIFCIVKGFIILCTGRLSIREEERCKEYTPAGATRYKKLTAAMNIIAGIAITGIAAARFFNLIERKTGIIIAAVLLAVLVAFFCYILQSCKKAK